MSETGLAVVVDALEFRRACIASLLGGWAAAEEITLLPLSPEAALRRLGSDAQCRLVVLNVGSAASSQPEVLAGIRVLRAAAPAAALVVVADRDEPGDVFAAMHAGVEAYVSNGLTPDLVFRALSFVLNGGTYFPRSIAEIRTLPGEPEPDAVRREETGRMPAASVSAGLAAEAANSDDVAWSARLLDLSARQMAILAGLCRGESNKVIGRTLNLPESTIKSHVREIMRKLAVSNRTQVALSIARIPLPIAVTQLITSPALAVSAEADGRSLPPCDPIPLVRADVSINESEAGGKPGK